MMSLRNTDNGSEGSGKDDRVAEYKNALTVLYEQFLHLKAHEEEQDKFVGRCIREGMTIEAGTDLAVILVRFSLNPSREETSRYVSALREADLQGFGRSSWQKRFASRASRQWPENLPIAVKSQVGRQ
jgi:hypothetical protein